MAKFGILTASGRAWPISAALLGLALVEVPRSWGQAAEAETPEAAAKAAPGVSQEAIAEWVRQLDDDRFAVREAAQHQLIAAGSAALELVGRAATAGSLESTTRAVSILLNWTDGEDAALGLGALEHLAALTNRPAESAMANNRLADVREKAAMEAFVDLGGSVEFDRLMPVLGPESVQLKVGPNWAGGADGLVHIAAMRHATTVSFLSAPIEGDLAIPTLSKASHVQRVEFFGTTVSDEALAKLGEALPHAVVEVRGAARLGVQGVEVAGGAGISGVQPGTAAAKAGLIPGDVITQIGDVAVENFAALTSEIAKAKVGDSVVLTVLRAGAAGRPPGPMQVTVTFEPWDDQHPVNPTGGSPLGSPVPRMPTPVFLDRR
jgi:hypothetical protein